MMKKYYFGLSKSNSTMVSKKEENFVPTKTVQSFMYSFPALSLNP